MGSGPTAPEPGRTIPVTDSRLVGLALTRELGAGVEIHRVPALEGLGRCFPAPSASAEKPDPL